MAAIPIVINCLVFRRDKTERPYPATIAGWAYDPTHTVGGGPILPPDQIPPDIEVPPDLGIWPNPPEGIAPHPEHPIVIPIPVPPEPPGGNPPVTIESPHLGWNFWPGNEDYPNAGWFYLWKPGPTDPAPKKK